MSYDLSGRQLALGRHVVNQRPVQRDWAKRLDRREGPQRRRPPMTPDRAAEGGARTASRRRRREGEGRSGRGLRRPRQISRDAEARRDKLRPDGSWVEEHAPGSSMYHITCAPAELMDTAGAGEGGGASARGRSAR